MAINIKKQDRAFTYNGLTLPDPGSNLTVEQVRDVYAAAYPEITSAVIEGPEVKGDKLVYTFKRAVGTKGATSLRFVPQARDGMTYAQVVCPSLKQPLSIRIQDTFSQAVDKLGTFIDRILFA